MNDIVKDVRNVFAESTKVRVEHEKEDRNVRDIIYSTFFHMNVDDNVPLIFLSLGSQENLIEFEERIYDPPIGVYRTRISGYECIKHIYDGGNYSVYILKRDTFFMYSLRGFMDYRCFSFLPEDFDLEEYKKFIGSTYVMPHMKVKEFGYPMLIEE